MAAIAESQEPLCRELALEDKTNWPQTPRPCAELRRRLTQLYVGPGALRPSAWPWSSTPTSASCPGTCFTRAWPGRSALTIGFWVDRRSALVILLAWIPLRERPGLGTVSNVVVIGFADRRRAARCCPSRTSLAARIGVPGRAASLLNGRRHGALRRRPAGARAAGRPDDRAGPPHRAARCALVRTGIEVVVVLAGWPLGGTFGVATVAVRARRSARWCRSSCRG